MHQSLAPLAFLFLAIALLAPPWMMLATALRRLRRTIMASHKSVFIFAGAVAGFSLAFNGLYILSLMLRSGPLTITLDTLLGIGLTLAWVTFWGRYVLLHFGRMSRSAHEAHQG